MAGEECRQAHRCILGHSSSTDYLLSLISGTKVFICRTTVLTPHTGNLADKNLKMQGRLKKTSDVYELENAF